MIITVCAKTNKPVVFFSISERLLNLFVIAGMFKCEETMFALITFQMLVFENFYV